MSRGLIPRAALASMVALCHTPAAAQKRVVIARPPQTTVVAHVDDSVVAPDHTLRAARAAPAVTRPHSRVPSLSVSTYVLSRLDDNVNRDTVGLRSVGMITGLSARLESGPGRPGFAAEYDVAMHRYSATTRFNRLSQRLRTTTGGRLQRWWTIELVTEGALKGSSEDRDVSDQLMLQPRTEFRLGSARRIRFVASQRWRRFPADTLQDASNRYVAFEFRHRFAEVGEFETEVRIETNDARGARFDYRRSSYTTKYATPLGTRALLSAELQYRVQRYAGRLVEIDDRDYPRRDHRLQPAATVQYRLGGVDLEASFEPEWRRSNDPTKSIDQHVLVLGVRRRW